MLPQANDFRLLNPKQSAQVGEAMGKLASGAKRLPFLRTCERLGGGRSERECFIEFRVAAEKNGLLLWRHFAIAQRGPFAELTDASLISITGQNRDWVNGNADLRRNARHDRRRIKANFVVAEDFDPLKRRPMT